MSICSFRGWVCVCRTLHLKNYAIHQTILLLTGNGIRILFCLCFDKNLSLFSDSKQRGSSIQARHLKGFEYESVIIGIGLSSFSFDKYVISQNDVIGTTNTGFSVPRTIQQLQNLTSTERGQFRYMEEKGGRDNIYIRHPDRNSKTFIFLLTPQHI